MSLNGLRVGELCAANVDDLGESTWHHTLTLRAETTKGGQAAVVALAPRTVQAISLTRDELRSGALLRNQHGRRMTSYNVAYLVTALCRDIGVGRRITPHSLRHSAITLALDPTNREVSGCTSRGSASILRRGILGIPTGCSRAHSRGFGRIL